MNRRLYHTWFDRVRHMYHPEPCALAIRIEDSCAPLLRARVPTREGCSSVRHSMTLAFPSACVGTLVVPSTV
jgi:hypothetical protein